MRPTPLILLALSLTPVFAQPTYTPYSFSTIAGLPGGSGTADGVGTGARFSRPEAVATDRAGNVYVTDSVSWTIRKSRQTASSPLSLARQGKPAPMTAPVLSPASADLPTMPAPWASLRTPLGGVWNITTLGGVPGQSSGVDGTGPDARFAKPFGIVADGAGNIYIADDSENRIVKGTPATNTDTISFDATADKLSLSGGVLHAFITGPAGRNAVIEESSDLKTWSHLDTKRIPAAGLSLSLPATAATHFFRAHLE